MAVYFVDSSAVVKRSVRETGSVWLSGLISPAVGNDIYLCAWDHMVRLQVETQSIPGYPPRQEENTMTILLKQAFEKARNCPMTFRINSRRRSWRTLPENSSGTPPWRSRRKLLEKLAEQALQEFEAGRTRPQGFDEL